MTTADESHMQVVEYRSLVELALPHFLPCFISQVVRCLTVAVLPLHVLSLGYSYDDVGLLSTIAGVGIALGNIPAGMLTTVCGPRFVLLVHCVLFTSSAALSCAASRVEAHLALPCFAASFLLLGTAESVGLLAGNTFMGSTAHSSLRGSAGSTQGGIVRCAASVGPLVGGMVAQAVGPIAVYALQVILAMLCAIAIRVLMPLTSATQDISTSGAMPRRADSPHGGSLSMADVVREHWRLLLSASTFVGLASYLRKSRELIFPLEGHERGLSQAEVGRYASLSFLVDFALFPVAGILMDRLGRTRTGALSFVLTMLSFLILQRNSPETFAMFAILGGIANGIQSGLTATFGADLAPADCRSNFLAVFRTLVRTGDPTASATLGAVANAGSLQGAEMMVAGFCLLGATFALCAVQEPPRKEAEAALPAAALPAAAEPSKSPASDASTVSTCDDERGDLVTALVTGADDLESASSAEPAI